MIGFFPTNFTIGHGKILYRLVQFLGRQFKKNPTCLRCGLADGGAAFFHGITAGGVPLVGRGAGFCGPDRDPSRIDVKLFSGNHGKGRFQLLAQLDLAGEHRDTPISVDLQP